MSNPGCQCVTDWVSAQVLVSNLPMLYKLLQYTAATWYIFVGITKCGSLGLWWIHIGGTAVQLVQTSVFSAFLSKSKTKKKWNFLGQSNASALSRAILLIVQFQGLANMEPSFLSLWGRLQHFPTWLLRRCYGCTYGGVWWLAESRHCTGALLFCLCFGCHGRWSSIRRLLVTAPTVEIWGNYSPPLSVIELQYIFILRERLGDSHHFYIYINIYIYL